MRTNRLLSGLYTLSEWITRMVYVNLLWVFFSFLGLLLFGIFPATCAMFSVMRKWVRKETDIPVFSCFWHSYKETFIQGNIIGFILVGVGSFLFYDYLFISQSAYGFMKLLYIPVTTIALLYCLTVFYVFPVYLHYEVRLLQVFKNVVAMVALNPFYTFFMVMGALVIGYCLLLLPGLIPLVGVSFLALEVTYFSQLAFHNVQLKKEKLNTE